MAILTITEALIRQYSSAESFTRGQAYYSRGSVGALVRRGDVLQAGVEGSDPEPYAVTVNLAAPGEVDARCTCPYDWGGWCKHIVATLLAALHDPAAIEERPPLRDLLATLSRDALQAILLGLAAGNPALADAIEAQISLSGIAASPAGAAPGTPAAAQVPRVTVAEVRRGLRSAFRGGGRGYDYASVGSIAGTVDQALQGAWRLIQAAVGSDALHVLEAITEEVWSAYEGLDDSDGEGVPLFEGIGAAWAEALLSPDVTQRERASWGAKLESWRDELADYGLEEGFEAAVQAADQGWEYPPLVQILRGEGAGEDGGEDEDWNETGQADGDEEDETDADRSDAYWIDNEALARARLNVLERQGRQDEYLRFADAAGQVVAYAAMLARQGRPAEAAAHGLAHMAAAHEALQLAQVLHERGEAAHALRIAEQGLTLEGPRALLADWTAELATALGETTRALAAVEIGFREDPTLERYRRAQDLAADWPAHRDALLGHLRRAQGYYLYGAGPVDVFLHEGLIDDAIAAVDRGVSRAVLETVADAALPSRPDWVVKTGKREAEAIMDAGKSQYYGTAARWVARVRDAYRAAGRDADWQAYLEHLLTEHGRKYRLVPLLKAL